MDENSESDEKSNDDGVNQSDADEAKKGDSQDETSEKSNDENAVGQSSSSPDVRKRRIRKAD